MYWRPGPAGLCSSTSAGDPVGIRLCLTVRHVRGPTRGVLVLPSTVIGELDKLKDGSYEVSVTLSSNWPPLGRPRACTTGQAILAPCFGEVSDAVDIVWDGPPPYEAPIGLRLRPLGEGRWPKGGTVVTVRKYLSEVGLNMQAKLLALLQQDGFALLPEGAGPFHLYLVLQRPRIALDPASVVFSEKEVRGRFSIQKQNKLEYHEFVGGNGLGTAKLTLKCDYPHTEYQVLEKGGATLSSGKVANLIAQISSKFWNHLDLEILYVGQSYGVEGSREAPARLAAHSTLQGIYAEAIRHAPDKEIWLLLVQFDEMRLLSFDGKSKTYGTTREKDFEHFRAVMGSDVSEQQRINFTEAALIRHFQPPFNTIYKEKFPSPAHSTYSQCYDIDLNAVAFEIDTEPIMCRLWSGAVAPVWTHFATFPLHSATARRSMFDLL